MTDEDLKTASKLFLREIMQDLFADIALIKKDLFYVKCALGGLYSALGSIVYLILERGLK